MRYRGGPGASDGGSWAGWGEVGGGYGSLKLANLKSHSLVARCKQGLADDGKRGEASWTLLFVVHFIRRGFGGGQ